jgi:hypothetical protein
MIKQIIIHILIVVSGVLSIFAQETNWDKVKNTSPSAGLIIELKSGKTVKGYLVSANDTDVILRDKKADTKLDKADISRVYAGIEKHKVPFWLRAVAGVATFIVVGNVFVYVLVKSGAEINSLGALGLVAAGTAATVVVTKNLRKLKSLKKGWLIYQAP